MNDETSVQSTVYRCPSCGEMIVAEVTRPQGGGDPLSVSYLCRGCGEDFGAADMMEIQIMSWVPTGSEVHRAGGIVSPDPSRPVVGWRIDFDNGMVCRASFWLAEVENNQDDLWDIIRAGPLLQGKSGNMRIMLSGVLPNPAEWASF